VATRSVGADEGVVEVRSHETVQTNTPIETSVIAAAPRQM
jgi:hypothetical protein